MWWGLCLAGVVSGNACPVFLEVEALAKFGSLKLGFFNGKQEQTFSF